MRIGNGTAILSPMRRIQPWDGRWVLGWSQGLTHDSSNRVSQGSGLGLATVRKGFIENGGRDRAHGLLGDLIAHGGHLERAGFAGGIGLRNVDLVKRLGHIAAAQKVGPELRQMVGKG